MPWYTTEGKDPHHIIRSEAQYIRNFAAIPFSARAGEDQKRALFAELEKLLEANGFKKEAIPKGAAHRLSYVEKGFFDSYGFAADADRSLYFNEPCSLAVTVGGRDLLTIRSLLSGRAVKEAQSIAAEAEELFDKRFEFAYSYHFGYLSPTLNRCGSGETLSVILFLPAIRRAGEICSLTQRCQCSNANLSPLFLHKDGAGDLYSLTFSPHHLSDRKTAAGGFDSLISGILEKEKHYESIIFAERDKLITDNAYRALGTLLYARRMSEEEMLCHLSSLRLLCAKHPDKREAHPIPLGSINLILAECLNASLTAADPSVRCSEDLEEKRASRIKELLADKSGEPQIGSKKT